MSSPVDAVLAVIDGALEDDTVSYDAMRWTPGEPTQVICAGRAGEVAASAVAREPYLIDAGTAVTLTAGVPFRPEYSAPETRPLSPETIQFEMYLPDEYAETIRSWYQAFLGGHLEMSTGPPYVHTYSLGIPDWHENRVQRPAWPEEAPCWRSWDPSQTELEPEALLLNGWWESAFDEPGHVVLAPLDGMEPVTARASIARDAQPPDARALSDDEWVRFGLPLGVIEYGLTVRPRRR